MKHTFDETTMQAAIDAACEALGKGDFRPTAGLLDTVPGCHDWKEETSTRLHLLKTALDHLPEPPPAEIPWTPWNGGECPLKAEAELANAKEIITTMHNVKLSTLRPISEAGDVPAGCVRVYGLWRRNKWVITMTCSQDTHCADIRLPESPKEANARAHAEFQAELEAVWNAPEVIRDGGEVLQVAPWTPQVGDVVTLKSGGPKMTVHQLFPEEDRVICYYFKRGILETPTFATATLTKAD